MNDLVALIAIVLFPGLVATIIADRLVVHVRPWTSLKYTVYSFVLGVSCYAALQLIVAVVGLFPSHVEFLPSLAGRLDVWTLAETRSSATVDLIEVLAATFCALPVAFLGAVSVNRKWLIRVAHRLRISRKYGDENLFSYYLNSDDLDWVYVRDVDKKLTYQGRINAYSETSELQEVVLTEVTVFGYENSDEYYSVPSIYVGRELGRLIIEAIPASHLGRPNVEESDNQREREPGQREERRNEAAADDTRTAPNQAAATSKTETVRGALRRVLERVLRLRSH